MRLPEVPSQIEKLKPYQAGKSIEEIREITGLEKIIKLASNENPLGASPKAVKRMAEVLEGVAIYPNAGLDLRKALAKKHNVQIENIVTGSGSESIMLNAMRAYLEPGDEVITAEGTFIGFYVIANAMNLDLVTVPLKNYTFDLEAILNKISDKTKLIYLANPNNPTGTAFTRDEFENFLERLPGGILVFMDEAYYEYATDWSEYPNSMDYKNDQLLTLRTFSKAYGLAGTRIGYGIGHPDIITNIFKVKLPFEPTSPSQAAGLGALEDDEFLNISLETNKRGIQRLEAELDRLGLYHPPTYANFVLVDMETPEKAMWLSDELLKHGVIARPMIPFRLPHTVRISTGTDDEMTMLIESLQDIFA